MKILSKNLLVPCQSFMKLAFRIFSVSGFISCSPPIVPAQIQNLCKNQAFNQKVYQTIRHTIPLMSVEELHTNSQNLLIFDARESTEYEVSHIPGATLLGYKNPNWDITDSLQKDKPIVVYCSIGYRSEKIGEILQEKGFTKVYNLYGSIFEWVNMGYPVLNSKGEIEKKIHTYNKSWSKWIDNAQFTKIW
jgi:rhodanese-related sulfurtransferase